MTRLTEPGSLYWPCRLLTSPFRRSWFDIQIVGLENVPVEGPVVLAPNHISFLDSFLMMYGLERKVLFLGKAEYGDDWKTRVFPAAGMIPVDRSGKGLVTSLGKASTVLESGGVIGIFPEGTRSRDGMVHKGHAGAAHLAMRTGAALVPVGIIGTDIAQPPDAPFTVRGAQITIRFGAPMDLAATGRGSKARKRITDSLMREIAVLAGRPYVDTLLAPGGAPVPAAVA